MILFDEDLILCQYHRNFLLNYFWKTTSGGLFMSNLYVIDIVGKRQAAALHEQLVRYYFWKTTSGSSSRATCALSLLENDKRQLFMSNLYVIIFGKRQAAVSLFEQLVRYYYFGKRQAAVSLFEQLVRYYFLEDSKWQFLYLNNLRTYNLIPSALMSISPEIS